jgi:type I restriction enzyme S subunit
MSRTQLLLKQARVSSIPQGWSISQIGKSCSIRNDLRKPISIDERSTINGDYPYYGPTGILDYIDEYLIDGEYALIGEDGDHFLKPQEKPQTIFAKGKFNVNNHAHVIASTKSCSSQWFAIFFKHRNISDFLSRQGANRYKLNKATLEKLPILLPPPSEQKAIAALLSTWDEAIEKTERLIQAKEKTFKQLLNDLIHQGRSNHTWKDYNLSDLCSPVSRKNGENNTNVLTSSAQNGLVSQLEYYNKSVSAENVTGYYLLKKGEFAYNRSSAKGYPYGATKRLDRYEKGVLSTLYLCFALKPNAPCESDFLLHLFESGAANRELRAVCQEGARSHGLLNITKSDFFGIKLFLPAQEQQKMIQSALNTAQEEIDLLKQLADKYKTQKRGLMQKMLTGEWRVKPEIVNQYMEA